MTKYTAISLLIFFINSYAQTWENFDTSNSSLLNNQINAIEIGEDSNIWLATDSGLVSIINSSWTIYSTEDGLLNSKIKNITISEKELILSSNNGMEIIEVSNNQIIDSKSFTRTSDGINSDSLNSIAMDDRMRYWLGTDLGISILADSSTINGDGTNGLTNSKVNQVNTNTLDWVQIGTNGKGVNRAKYDAVDGITSASDIIQQWSGLASDTVFCIYVTDDTLNWYGTSGGVSTHFGSDTKANWWIYNTEFSKIVDNTVRAIVRDKNGLMWFGTKNGLSGLDTESNTWYSFTTVDGLISNNIFDIEVDTFNNLWIGTDSGISKYSNLPTSIVTKPPQSHSDIYLNVYPNPFNPSTTIEYFVGSSGPIELSVFNNLGERILIVEMDYVQSGIHNYSLDMKNKSRPFPSGIYYLSLISENHRISKKILFLK